MEYYKSNNFSRRVPGHFETLAVSKRLLAVLKRPNYLLGRFETFLGFEMAWPVQNLVSKWPNKKPGHFETSPDF